MQPNSQTLTFEELHPIIQKAVSEQLSTLDILLISDQATHGDRFLFAITPAFIKRRALQNAVQHKNYTYSYAPTLGLYVVRFYKDTIPCRCYFQYPKTNLDINSIVRDVEFRSRFSPESLQRFLENLGLFPQ